MVCATASLQRRKRPLTSRLHTRVVLLVPCNSLASYSEVTAEVNGVVVHPQAGCGHTARRPRFNFRSQARVDSGLGAVCGLRALNILAKPQPVNLLQRSCLLA